MRPSKTPALLGLALALLVMLAGCVPQGSLSPLWTEDSLVFEPALVGTWVLRDNWSGTDMTLRFTASGGKAYRVSLFSRKPDKEWEWSKRWSLEFDGHLVRLGDSLFLDLYPATVAQKEKDQLVLGESIFVQRLHTFYRVELRDRQLVLRYLDDDWVERMVKEKELSTWCAKTDPGDHCLLVATTRELQQMAKEHAHDPQAFTDMNPFVREK